MDQVWIQHDTKVLQNMTDFGRKSGDVENVHILHPSTDVAMELIFKKVFSHENFPIGSIKKKHKPSIYPPKNANIPCSNLCGMLPILSPLILIPTKGSVPPRLSWCFGPQNTEMQRIFSPTNFRREVIGTHCANASIPEAGNQRRPAELQQDHFQFKINEM